jgi:hypothetical protein
MRLPPSEPSPRLCGGGTEGAGLSAFHRGTCCSDRTPQLSSRTRFLGHLPLREGFSLKEKTWRHQVLPASGLSQTSDRVADRSSCRPGVFPELPGSGGDEPPPAGTALAPPARVIGRRPSRERDWRFVAEMETDVKGNVALSVTATGPERTGVSGHHQAVVANSTKVERPCRTRASPPILPCRDERGHDESESVTVGITVGIGLCGRLPAA